MPTTLEQTAAKYPSVADYKVA
ncbi:MAG: hypothetical protein JWM54_803, partial [Acidobacteriaceae bacterium]|nr:hypothetical protein [Acidobacteriaceae bacterium]